MHSVRLVIGYGNPLRADDGLGWVVAQRLKRDLDDDAQLGDVVVLVEHQLTPELAEPISRARLVIFVDARAGDQPGRVERQVVAPTGAAPSGEESLAFSHDVDPPSLVRMARLLYGHCPTAVVISVDGADFGYGISLSPVVRAAVPEVVRSIRDVLAHGAATLSARVAIVSGQRSIGG
jgi:hydrogenase maturation protease